MTDSRLPEPSPELGEMLDAMQGDEFDANRVEEVRGRLGAILDGPSGPDGGEGGGGAGPGAGAGGALIRRAVFGMGAVAVVALSAGLGLMVTSNFGADEAAQTAVPSSTVLIVQEGVAIDDEQTVSELDSATPPEEPSSVATSPTPRDSTSRRVSTALSMSTVSTTPHFPAPLETQAVREYTLLARARAMLPTQPEVTLALAREHRERFPRGTLTAEREYLAISALAGLGRSVEMRSRAARFQRQWPHSIYRRAVAEMLDDGTAARPQVDETENDFGRSEN